jgi:hypothetical protein
LEAQQQLIDGDNNPVLDGGTTTSTDITFAFSGATSFECSLDYSTFEACTSPHTYTGLELGEHTFDVRALDNNGDRQVPPTRFTWTMQEAVDPTTAIEDLIMDIRTLDGVNFFVKLVLISQLRIALIFVSDSSTANDFISCGAMNSFIATVNAYENRGRLTEAQADNLIQQAEVIREAIGCTFSSAQEAGAVEAASEAVEELTTEPHPPNSDRTSTPSAMFLPN